MSSSISINSIYNLSPQNKKNDNIMNIENKLNTLKEEYIKKVENEYNETSNSFIVFIIIIKIV